MGLSGFESLSFLPVTYLKFASYVYDAYWKGESIPKTTFPQKGIFVPHQGGFEGIDKMGRLPMGFSDSVQPISAEMLNDTRSTSED